MPTTSSPRRNDAWCSESFVTASTRGRSLVSSLMPSGPLTKVSEKRSKGAGGVTGAPSGFCAARTVSSVVPPLESPKIYAYETKEDVSPKPLEASDKARRESQNAGHNPDGALKCLLDL